MRGSCDRVLVLGDINADIAIRVESLPRLGGDTAGHGLTVGSGGGGLNAAVTFRALGAQARLLGRVGRDRFAAVALRTARDRGVDCNAVQTDDLVNTGVCTVLVTPEGERSFVSFRGANVRFDPRCVHEHVSSKPALCYLSAYAMLEGPQAEAASELVRDASSRGIPVALDLCVPAAEQCRDEILRMMPSLTLFSTNEEELRVLVEGLGEQQAIEKLLGLGVRYVALKRGARGAAVFAGGDRAEVAVHDVRVADTTACGDAFAAACAFALVRGGSIQDAARLATALGTQAALRAGAADSIPTHAMLSNRLEAPLIQLLVPRRTADDKKTSFPE